MLETLKKTSSEIGKPEWRDMLVCAANLHERDVRPAEGYFPYPWEEIGVGYVYGPAFGHWDIAHIIMDLAADEPLHAQNQILNDLAHQRADGFLPGSLYVRQGKLTWSEQSGHAPVWMYAADEAFERTKDRRFLKTCLDALIRQIGWFEKERRAVNGGYFYLDILNDKKWESGIDEGVRFLNCGDSNGKKHACIDATAHVYGMLDEAVKWCGVLGENAAEWAERRERTRREIDALYDAKTGWFYDCWDLRPEGCTIEAFEGMWPLVCGAATREQAQGVRSALMNPSKFFTVHPIPSVAIDSPHFEKRMWRGPVWNSMTMWAAFGLLRYGFNRDAALLAERALDASARVFKETGKIWEFYDSLGGDPRLLARKPTSERNMPCTDYMGHAPLIWLARVWEENKGE